VVEDKRARGGGHGQTGGLLVGNMGEIVYLEY